MYRRAQVVLRQGQSCAMPQLEASAYDAWVPVSADYIGKRVCVVPLGLSAVSILR
jgi:hypothetical protein